MGRLRCFLGSLLLSFLVAGSLSQAAIAEEIESSSEGILFTPEMAVEFAQDFVDSVNPSGDLTASGTTKLYEPSGQAIGYIVDYISDYGDPNGYIIFDNSDESLISEYCFDEGAINPYVAAVESSQTSSFRSLQEPIETKAVKTSSFVYAAVDPNDGSGVDMYGDEVLPQESASMLRSPISGSWDDVFLGNFGSALYTIVDAQTVPQFISFSETQIEQMTGKYACGVSAMLNAACHYMKSDFSYSQISSYYSDLWNRSGTSVYKVEGGISYGETYSSNYGPALKSFLASKGVNVIQAQQNGASFDFYKTTIQSGDVAIFSCGINLPNSDGVIGRSGHSMTVEGYATLSSNSTGAYFNALVVADGWTSNARCLNFGYGGYTDTHGTFFTES